MSIHGAKCILTVIAVVGSLTADTLDRRVRPVEAQMKRAQKQGSKYDIGIAGILGYTANCGLAVYSNPGEAIRRNRAMAFQLGDKSSSVRFPPDSKGLPDYVGRYVYAEGQAVADPMNSASKALSEPSVFHAFADRRWQLGSHCVSGRTDVLRSWVQLSDLVANPTHYVGRQISVAGVFGHHGGRAPAIYLDDTSASVGVDANAVIVDCARSRRYKKVCNLSLSNSGKYAIVVAFVTLGKVRGSTSVVLEDVASLEFLDPEGAP